MTLLPSGPTYSEELRAAVRRFESGLYGMAGQQVLTILQKNPNDQEALYLLRLVERRLGRTKTAAKPTLIWQFDPDGAWESDWLNFLLRGAVEKTIVDNTWSQLAPTMIVVDNRLVEAKVQYYRRAFEAGCRVILIHLSDEAFKDDLTAYRYCDAVIRNYHSEVLAESNKIKFFPLGYKSGFAHTAVTPKAVKDRKYLWSFAGDAKKLTRSDMLKAMAALDGGFQHLTEGFGSADALTTSEYRTLMDETVLAPCPGGWSNLETFRVYEALEAGCIPIVEQRPGFDYFTRLLGPHPIPTVLEWSEAPDLARRLQVDGELEPLRQQCAAWWATYKPALARTLSNFMERRLKPF
jgi:hypothetical protein